MNASSVSVSNMPINPSIVSVSDWRVELPTLTARVVTLREPVAQDVGPLVDLLSVGDSTRFGLEDPVTDVAVQQLIDRIAHERAAGSSFTFAVTPGAGRALVGLVQVRQILPGFEMAEWECTLAPSVRGSGIFVETARLVGSFAFGSVGAHRLEARVLLKNGRGNGALRKLGAVQEGILRRSIRQGDDYLDQVLWSMLKEDWGDHWISTAPRVH
jgi:RimJ/RimL family protein N-acetyltransferase